MMSQPYPAVVPQFGPLGTPRACRALGTCGSVTSAKTFVRLFSITTGSHEETRISAHSLGHGECADIRIFSQLPADIEKVAQKSRRYGMLQSIKGKELQGSPPSNSFKMRPFIQNQTIWVSGHPICSLDIHMGCPDTPIHMVYGVSRQRTPHIYDAYGVSGHPIGRVFQEIAKRSALLHEGKGHYRAKPAEAESRRRQTISRRPDNTTHTRSELVDSSPAHRR